MTYIDIKLFKDIAKGMALLLLVVLACGRTMGAGAVLAVGATFLCAMSGRLGWAIALLIFMPSAAYLASFRSILAGENVAVVEAAHRESAGIKLFAGVMEVRNQAITKWIRKTEEVSKDTRTVGEAFTASRMGLVEGLMADFKRNPLFGSGFQVTREMQYTFKHHKGMILSVPIEKGDWRIESGGCEK